MAGDVRSVSAAIKRQSIGQCNLLRGHLSICDTKYSFGRYIVAMAVADATDQIWLSGFNEVGNALFGISGNELHSLRVSSFLCSTWEGY